MKSEVVSFLLLEEQYHIDIVTRAIKMIDRVSNMMTYFITYLCFRSDCIYHAIKKQRDKKDITGQKTISRGKSVIQRDRSDITGQERYNGTEAI